MYEEYSFQKSFFVRLIRFLSSLCIVVFVLDVTIMICISSMNYRLHSMEISVQKVLGYSMYERNKGMILYNLISDIVLLFVMCILGAVTGIFSPFICILIGSAILLVEMVVMTWNIIKVERENTYKVLKGGCL